MLLSIRISKRLRKPSFNPAALASREPSRIKGARRMHVLVTAGRFLRSRSGHAFLLHMGLCAVLSAAVGIGFYCASLNWFVEHKSQEKIAALRLVDAFVTEYSSLRSTLGGNAPVPASFRAHSIDKFNAQRKGDDVFLLRSVGRPGREIKTAPSDADMARTVEALASAADPKPVSKFLKVDGRTVFRTVYPSFAREQSCVSCHNQIQPNKPVWRLNDLMGAFVIDVPAAPFLHSITLQSAGLGIALLIALGIVGLIISRQHFVHMTARDKAAAEIGRTRKFLDTVVENIPAMVTVQDAAEQKFVLVNRSAEELFGAPRQDIIGRKLHDVLSQQEADFLGAQDEAVLKSQSLATIDEHVVRTSEDETRILSTKKITIPD